ncbi:MAG: sensor histidine kinase [Desulfococcaceae bacterium]
MTADAGADLPPVRADANKVAWVLTNRISNASRYVEEGGHIRLAAKAAGPNVHFSVTDDGPGIPAEYQTRIFQRFVQVRGRPGGTGLGLAICQEIVRAHGGTIWVESRPGEGGAFTVALPKPSEEKEKGA